MFRRLAVIACGLSLVVALAFAAMHRHEVTSRASTTGDAACLYCAGGILPGQAPTIAAAPERIWTSQPEAKPSAPALKRLQPLAHSGNAPPV